MSILGVKGNFTGCGESGKRLGVKKREKLLPNLNGMIG